MAKFGRISFEEYDELTPFEREFLVVELMQVMKKMIPQDVFNLGG